MICTCDNCHYTFVAPTLPTACPDCGKEKINRRIGNKIISAPAVREATDDEKSWFKEMQAELAEEDQRKETVKSLEKYAMTEDEYNWALILIYEHSLPKTDDAKHVMNSILRSALSDPEKTLSYYQDIKKMFTRHVSDDRSELSKAGKSEPVSIYDHHWDEGGDDEDYPAPTLISGLEQYGPALYTLYHFRRDEDRPFFLFGIPNLGNIRRIDLKKIAEDPSAGYAQFLLDWTGSLV